MHLVQDLGQIILEKDDTKILLNAERLSIFKMLIDKNLCYEINLIGFKSQNTKQFERIPGKII